jgi:hypothetical protein
MKYYINMSFLSGMDTDFPPKCYIKYRAIGVSDVSMAYALRSLGHAFTRLVILHTADISLAEINQAQELLKSLIKYDHYQMMPPCGARNGSVVACVYGE